MLLVLIDSAMMSVHACGVLCTANARVLHLPAVIACAETVLCCRICKPTRRHDANRRCSAVALSPHRVQYPSVRTVKRSHNAVCRNTLAARSRVNVARATVRWCRRRECCLWQRRLREWWTWSVGWVWWSWRWWRWERWARARGRDAEPGLLVLYRAAIVPFEPNRELRCWRCAIHKCATTAAITTTAAAAAAVSGAAATAAVVRCA
jgi:hypothetical protein